MAWSNMNVLTGRRLIGSPLREPYKDAFIIVRLMKRKFIRFVWIFYRPSFAILLSIDLNEMMTVNKFKKGVVGLAEL